MLPFKVTNWWETQNSLYWQYKRYKEDKYLLNIKQNQASITSLNSFFLPVGIQLELNMRGSTSSLAGTTNKHPAIFFLDAGISKNVLKKKLNVAINVTDITGILNNYKTRSNYNNIEYYSVYNADNRSVTVSLRYNFQTGKNFSTRTNRAANWEERSRAQ